jgi:hypothetical protein
MQPVFGKILDVQRDTAAMALPGIKPVGQADWITVDACYADQIATKQRLLQIRCDDVLKVLPEAQAATEELLVETIALLSKRNDFTVTPDRITCPDGRLVDPRGVPLEVLAQLIQEDLVVHQPMGDGHGMTAALLCFPASWTLAQKIGKPLIAIHTPVPDYTPNIATRVQRLFDGVQVGRPLWRANLLRYDDPALFQPRTENNPKPVGTVDSPYERSERQTLFRLPQTRAVIFAIHTTVAKV